MILVFEVVQYSGPLIKPAGRLKTLALADIARDAIIRLEAKVEVYEAKNLIPGVIHDQS